MEPEWRDPPPLPTTERGQTGRWVVLLTPLMDQPGRWAVIERMSADVPPTIRRNRLRSKCAALRTGLVKIPPGKWEFHDAWNTDELYARYIGPD